MVSQAQNSGDLGLGALKHRNLALIAKWGWRFIHDPNSLWRQVIVSIHGSQDFNGTHLDK